MRQVLFFFIITAFLSCHNDYRRTNPISSVQIEPIYNDETLSIRALDFNDEYIFYGSSNHIGKRALGKEFNSSASQLKVSHGKNHFKYVQNFNDAPMHFRAIEEVNGDLFAISIGNPARLYKLRQKAKRLDLVYEEMHEKVFYDAISFWNNDEGMAIGDPTEDCMSVIITRNGGETWKKLSCNNLPKIKNGEAAFAASDSNISIVGNHTWVATGGKASRVLYSPDKGKTWRAFDTPIVQGQETTGMYSIDFYDAHNGFAIGGDYTKPDNSVNNKIRTVDGGKTWQVVSNGNLGYRSCVQYIPNSDAKELVAVGFKGIDYSNDSGTSWKHLSDEGFYTIRFLNDSVAYAAGKGRLSKLTFR